MKLLKSKIKIPWRNNLLAGIHISVWLNKSLMYEKLDLLELSMRGGFHEPLYRASEWGADTEQPLLSGAAYYCVFCGAGRLPCTQCSRGLAVCIFLSLGLWRVRRAAFAHHLSRSTSREWQRERSLRWSVTCQSWGTSLALREVQMSQLGALLHSCVTLVEPLSAFQSRGTPHRLTLGGN